jgi:carbamoyl-phosphate synthase large subunit
MGDPKIFQLGANANHHDIKLAETDEFEILPRADSKLYLDRLNDVIEKHRIDFVHAQSDEEVAALSRKRSKVKAKVMLPSVKAIDRCQDKGRSAILFQERGVPCPVSEILYSTSTARDAIASYVERFGKAWIRLRYGAGGSGAICTDDPDFALAWIRHKALSKDQINIYNWMVAEALPGDTVTVQQFWREGTLISSQQRMRFTWANAKNAPTGVSGSTGIGVTSSHKEPDEVAMKAIRSVDFKAPNGLYGVDMVWDMVSEPKVTEINAGRFFTTNSEFFGSLAGNRQENMAYAYTYVAMTGDLGWLEKPLINALPDGKKWIRGMDVRPVLA